MASVGKAIQFLSMAVSAQFTIPSLAFNQGQTFPEFTTLHNGQELIWEFSVHEVSISFDMKYTVGLYMTLKSPEKIQIQITKGYMSNRNGKVLRCLEGKKFKTGNIVCLIFLEREEFVQFHILDVRPLISLKRKRDDFGSKLLEKVMRGDPDPNFDGNFRLVSADGSTFYCHKAILGELEYFEWNFENKTKDVIEGKVEFKDIRSSTLRKILSLAYTGEYEKVKEYDFVEIKGLFYAFDKFMLKKESDELQKEVVKFLGPKSVGEILVMSDVYNLAYLKANALKMAKKNVKVLYGPIWEDIYARKDLVKEILEDFAK